MTGQSFLSRDSVRRVLLVRLRSIGDTVLMTPCLQALKDWQPAIEIDVLVESLSAPLLRAHPMVDNLFVLPDTRTQLAKLTARSRIVRQLRARRYDVAFNLHGGTTATFLTRLTGAPIRIGYHAQRYSTLFTHCAPPPQEIWQKPQIHCVEQQLGLLKWAGVPIAAPPALSLAVEPAAAVEVDARLAEVAIKGNFVVVHPSAAFASKQWEAARFARAIEHLHARYQLPAVVVVAPQERAVAEAVVAAAQCPVISFADLDLAHLMALIARATLFLGNDSGPAHIAAAYRKPVAVIFGSSNSRVWHPWTANAYQLLRTEMACAPCPGYTCSEFPEPECIKRISVAEVTAALDSLLNN